MNHQELFRYISFAIDAHGLHAKTPRHAVRLADGKTAYAVHPLWCAMTILAEHGLPKALRFWGTKVLLLHDVMEDTTARLPAWVPGDVAHGVKDMTFASFEEETRLIWDKSREVRLLKLYDKVSNLLDAAWMSAGKWRMYKAHTLELAKDVEDGFGDLHIVCIARAVCRVEEGGGR